MKNLVWFFLSVLLGAFAENSVAAEPSLKRSEFMQGLENPWEIAFTPDGAVFVTEKCKGLKVRRPDGSMVRLFGAKGSVVVAKDFFCEGQSGMHGVVLDPNFSKNRMIYVFMPSKSSNGKKTNHVVQMTVDEKYSAVSGRKDIIIDIPFKSEGNRWGGAGLHSGGRLAFGPDGFLYVSTGDNHNGTIPQDLKSLGGKVLRITREGKPAPGKKIEGADPRIFTYGHRNVQGLCFHPSTGQIFASEHGPNHSDEVTALEAGGNGGWDPKPDPGVSCGSNYCGYTSNKADGTPTPMTDLSKFPNALKPVISYEDSQGMGPCLFLKGEAWKDWNGQMLVGLMASTRMDVLYLGKKNELLNKTSPDLPSERFRSLVQGPEGDLFIVTDGGDILRVTPR